MNHMTTIDKPMGGQVVTSPSNALANGEQQRAIAEVQAAMVIARSNPRDQLAAVDRILNACQRKGLAEVAVYSYARGGSDITGPSIRLAEALAQNWGNIQFGIRELEQRNGESVVQAFAWDVETNVRREMSFTVPHIRHTKQGAKRLTDPRDIYEMVANNGARRLRSCILAVIPGDVIDSAVEQCEKTMKINADTSPEAMQQMVNAFQAFGVVQQQIEARIQRRLDAIQPAQVVALKKVYASLRDGMSSPADWFDPIEDAADAQDENPQTGVAAAIAAIKGHAESKSSAGEQLGDEIPALAKQDDPPSKDETISDDNHTAEEGPADDQRGEADPGNEPAWLEAVRGIRGSIAAARTLKAITNIEHDWLNRIRVSVSDEGVIRSVEGDIAAKKRDLAAGGEG